jgi:tape measure domain-containing protein
MVDLGISVGFIPDDSGARVIKRSLDDMNSAGRNASNENKRLEQQIRSTTNAAHSLGNAFKTMFAAYGVREIINMADQYTVMESRIRSIVKTTQETTRVTAELRKISAATGSEMETSLSIMQRLSFVREEIKATNNDMLAFTETVTKLGVTSGALPEAMKAGLTQLGQALSSQYTRAEEFNSIMENIPAVGKAIADELNVTTGQMRLLVVEGKLLSSDVFAAILNQTEKVRLEFEEFPKTASQGAKQLANSFQLIIAQANAATGATNGIGMALRGVGEGAKAIYDGLGTVFDFLVAGIQEGVNLISKAINKLIEGINLAKQIVPFADKTPIGLINTVDAGSILLAANAGRKEREKALFGDDFASAITPDQRKISQDYAKIAAGLNVDKEAKKAADKAAREALQEQKRLENELESAINGSRTAQEKLNDEIKHLESLKGVAKTDEQVELLNRGIRNTQAEIDKLALKAELDSPLAKGFAAIADEVQDGFKDAFKGAFDGGGSLFKKFADGIKATFKSLLLDLAYQAAVRPIVVSVLGGIGGAAGISSSALASVLGTTGSGTSGGGIGSLFSTGSSLLSAGKAFLSGGSITNGLAGLGVKASNFLGGSFGTSTNVGNFISNAGTFGNIAGGFAGGLGANLLGLGNKNGYVNAATGTIGGLIGSIGGPLGSAAGSFIGTALGGLFGGKAPSNKEQAGVINLANMGRVIGGQTGKKYSAENANYVDAILDNIQTVLKAVQGAGGKAKGSIEVAVGNRDGLKFNGKNYGYNQSAFNEAILKTLTKSISGLDSTFTTILKKVGVANGGNLASAFEFGQQYNDTLNPMTPAKMLADSIKLLDDNMSNLVKTATALGLPTEEYTKALQKQRDVAVGAMKAQTAGFASLEEMTRTFDSFFNSQALGENSSLNPTEKLGVAQNSFGDLLKKAQGGDLTVTQDLLSSANTLLGVGRDVYASGANFSGLESFVKSSVSGVANQAGYTGQNVSYSIVSTNQIVSNNIVEMNAKITALTAEIFRLSNKLAAA